jgi:hypothetical protein
MELGAVRRLRGFSSVESLLRVLLIHLADGCLLRETVVRARAGDLAAVSDVALLKRLRACAAWFQWVIQALLARQSLSLMGGEFLGDRPVRLMDGRAAACILEMSPANTAGVTASSRRTVSA